MSKELIEAVSALNDQVKALSTEMHKEGLLADDIMKSLAGPMGRDLLGNGCNRRGKFTTNPATLMLVEKANG